MIVAVILPKNEICMGRNQISVRLALFAVAISALALWMLIPRSQIEIRIMPDDSLRLNSTSFESEQQFWLAFAQRIKTNRSWGREANVQIAYPSTINYSSVTGVILSMSPHGVDNYDSIAYDPDTGKILREPVP